MWGFKSNMLALNHYPIIKFLRNILDPKLRSNFNWRYSMKILCTRKYIRVPDILLTGIDADPY